MLVRAPALAALVAAAGAFMAPPAARSFRRPALRRDAAPGRAAAASAAASAAVAGVLATRRRRLLRDANCVVVGGGFAGLTAARKLAARGANVTVLTTTAFFEYTPSVLRALAGADPSPLVCPVERIVPRGARVVLVDGSAPLDIDTAARTVTTAAATGGAVTAAYDYVVLATGSSYAAPIKGTVNSQSLAGRVEALRGRAAALASAESVLVVGGGVVGCELAADLAAARQGAGVAVHLAHEKRELCEEMPKAVRARVLASLKRAGVNVCLGERLADKEGAGTYVGQRTGRKVKADAAVLCVGFRPNGAHIRVRNSPPGAREAVTERGFVAADAADLSVDGTAGRVFAVGDVRVKPLDEYQASFAHFEAEYVVERICHRRRSPAAPYRRPAKATIFSLGPRDGVFTVGDRVVATGRAAAAAKALCQFWFTHWLPAPYWLMRRLPGTAVAASNLPQPPTPTPAATEQKKPVAPKRKVAVLIGYAGGAYQGFQRNAGTTTIEDIVEAAFHAAGGIVESNLGELQKIGWSRAARTDKGVSAAVNVVAAKLRIEAAENGEAVTRGDELAFLARTNAALPEDVVAYDIKKVAQSFSAKNFAGKRRYEYLLPTYALSDPEVVAAALRAAGCGGDTDAAAGPSARPTAAALAAARAALTPHRASAEALARLAAAWGTFKGTHKFHNFSKKLRPTDDAARRYMLELSVSAPVVLDGVEHVVLSVVGQSFVLHQIRKMVAASVDVARGAAPPDAIATLLGPERAQCPMAPGVGLYLCQPYFDGYNDKYAGSAAGEGGKEGYCGLARDAVDTEGPGVAAAVDAFKAGVVLPGMAKQEAQRSEFIAWLANLHRHKASWYRPFDLEKENGGGGGYGYGPQE